MASSIPLVRASAVTPLEIWMKSRGLPSESILAKAGLPPSPLQDPERIVSFHCFIGLLAELAETEGPDLGARISTPEALMHLGVPARAILSSRTVREALIRIERSFHLHASHVYFHLVQVPGGLELQESIPMAETCAIHHQTQQHVASLILSIGLLASGRPLSAAVQLAPHPQFGLDHLMPYLGPDLTEARGRQMRLTLTDEVLDMPLPGNSEPTHSNWVGSLEAVGRPSLTESARILVAGMIADGNPSMDRLSMLAGRSRRTLQRLLASEGTCYAELIDGARADLALSQLKGSGDSVSSIANRVGFRSTASLTRAVRRWANACPREIRQEHRAA